MARPEMGPLPDVRLVGGVVVGGEVAGLDDLEGLDVYVIEASLFDEVLEVRRGLLLDLYAAPWWRPLGAPSWLTDEDEDEDGE